MAEQRAARARIPVSTYRLQFNHEFTFEQARALVDYLCELGITDCYSSPILKARAGSLHGYDVVDHTQINPEIGSEEQFAEFARELRRREMGVVMDTVPNHMCIAGSENRWWLDLLENGPGSPYARFFDVDWNRPAPKLSDKVLLPILGDQYGRVLENQEVKISYRGGAFFANYYETALPIAPRTSTHILNLALRETKNQLAESHGDLLELESIITALGHLPLRNETDPARVRERRREKEVIKRRLSNLVKQSREVRHAIYEALMVINGTKGRPATFDRLEELLSEQAYRLSYWRVAADEINYRRFFDINELAAVRVEERPVFTAVHEIIFRHMRQGLVTGLRIDHVDGLFNPEKYLSDLQRECRTLMRAPQDGDGNQGGGGQRGESEELSTEEGIRDGTRRRELPCYILVEKILGHDEELRREWPIHGTTGYEFTNTLNGIFVDTENGVRFQRLYSDFIGSPINYNELLYQCKRLILRVSMSSELHVLARRLERISEQHRWSRDFTFNSLQEALGEVIACFPVYRSYIRRKHTSVRPEDRQHIEQAIRAAMRRNPGLSQSLFDFIGALLLLNDPKGLSPAQRAERRDFVMRFQQLTSPVMAKGLEDTAFYRYYPLASLNEVGGEPARFGISLEGFHRRNEERVRHWPDTLSATSTHDSKRSEDVRARINVLSEIPDEWERAIRRWREMNRAHKRQIEDAEAPDANEEYLLYQTLVGAWPLAPMSAQQRGEFIGRIQEYMQKALKEAKVHTSWINPNEPRERAVREFVEACLTEGEGNAFPPDFIEFQKRTARAGMFNSLAQTLLKIASPGVPDFYQGTELWDFSLVDPDNRRPVDYGERQRLLASLREAEQAAATTAGDTGEGGLVALADQLVRDAADGRLKLYVTRRALRFRRENRELFADSGYLPLQARGARARNVVAFARQGGGRELLAVAARFYTQLENEGAALPCGADVWGDTALPCGDSLAPGRFRDVLTGREFEATGDSPGLSLAEVFAHLPVALLERVG